MSRQLSGLNFTEKSTRIYIYIYFLFSLAIPIFYGVYREGTFSDSERADNCTHKIRAPRLLFLRRSYCVGGKMIVRSREANKKRGEEGESKPFGTEGRGRKRRTRR